MAKLDSNLTDHLVSVVKGVVAAFPFFDPIFGSLVSEVIGNLIPNQRLDRITEFLRQLEKSVNSLGSRLEHFEKNVQTPNGLSIFEEGLLQATRSASNKRKKRLARLVAYSLTADEVKYEETRKLLNLFRDITDPEVIWLVYYSMDPTFGPGPHRDLVEKNPDVLRPVSLEVGLPQEQIDRRALQESYKNTLLRYGLIKLKGNSYRITTLGRLLVRYISECESDKNQS